MQSSHFGKNMYFNAILNCVVLANGSVATNDVGWCSCLGKLYWFYF